MPIYHYRCSDCGVFEQMNTMALSREPSICPNCQRPAARTISAPYLASPARDSIKAASLNERAQNEPMHSSQLPGKHKPGCSCCSRDSSALSAKQTVRNAAGDKMFPGKRPWMISH